MSEFVFTPRSPFEAYRVAPSDHAGVLYRERAFLGMASLHGRNATAVELATSFHSLYGFDHPHGPRVCRAGTAEWVGTGPNAWLVVDETQGFDLAPSLARDFTGLAAVVDQSDAYGVISVSGPRALDTLAKGFAIDLHPAVFAAGCAAVTMIAHMDVIVWRNVEESAAADVTYNIATFRSMAGNFWEWLTESTAEFGLAPRSAAAF